MNRSFRAFLSIPFLLISSSLLQAQLLPPSQAGMFRPVFQVEGEYINDHCLIRAAGRWHLYFIESKIDGSWGSPSSETTIGHASSVDLLRWELHPPALQIGPPGSRDGGHVYAPSVIERHGVYYMIYTGNEKSFHAGENLFLATSTDLFNWKRHSDDPIFAPDSSWASWHPVGFEGGRGGPQSARDPHIVVDSEFGNGYICYYVARLKADSTRPSEEGEFSCIAAATSKDMIHWVDRGPVLTRRTIGEDIYTWGHPESPCLVWYENRYYLFWKSGSGIRYVIGSTPLDFHDRNEYFMSTAHASEIFSWNDQWFITSCSRDIDDITHGASDRKRGLFLAAIRWNGRHPEVAPLPEEMR